MAVNLAFYAFTFILCWLLYKYLSTPKKVTINPFSDDSRKPLKKKVTNQKERDDVLKQGFKAEKVPKDLDAIIIGSGIGALSTAAILSKTGAKVLILEQHDQAGGCCHTFVEKGYEFDVGIHYIGDMLKPSVSKTYLDQISEGQIVWEEMCDDFDHIVFKEPDSKVREYTYVANIERQKTYLKKCFPEESDAINKFYDLVVEVAEGHHQSLLVKFLPLWLVKLMLWTHLLGFVTNFYQWNDKTVKEVVQGLTSNQELQDILCYCFGDYGTVPSQAGFPMQCLLLHHFTKGAAYPVGGASEIAFNIIPVIENAGGKVLVHAKVTDILMDSGRAVGVKVKHGTAFYNLFAKKIISDAGIFNTFQKLLPSSIASKSRLWPFVQRTPHGVAAISLFVGIDCPGNKLDIAHKKNMWIFTKNDIDKTCVEYMKLSQEEAEDADLPLMFISFPSSKDPTWDERYPGKTTMVGVTLSNYEWFTDWESKSSGRRGDDYESVKKTLGQKMIDHACDLFPNMRDHIDYVNIGSPLSNNFYLGSSRGEIYGLDHDNNRFSALNSALLRPKTDIPGLFLTGQDVCSGGFTGALYGGLICAQQILKRNVMNDIISLHKSLHS